MAGRSRRSKSRPSGVKHAGRPNSKPRRELPSQVTGVYYDEADGKRGHYASPTSRFVNKDIKLTKLHGHKPNKGDLLHIALKPAKHFSKYISGEILEILGGHLDVDAIVLHNHDIPQGLSEQSLAEAEAAGPPTLGDREDLRNLPLVTIDGADARDFDDAVFAEPATVNGTKGWHLIVAIADVSHYVQPGSALDEEALNRGNSVYLPARVVPMLPEALSNGWCSLVPNEDRACLAVHMYVDAHGTLQEHRFARGLMRSHHRWTYELAAEALTGNSKNKYRPDPDRTAPEYLQNLQSAYHCLRKARDQRGALNIHTDELQVQVDGKGKAVGLTARPGLFTHQLIEEFMVLANVAAATSLLQHEAPGLFRIHPEPASERLLTLQSALKELGLRFDLPKDGKATPHLFNTVLHQAKGKPFAIFLNMLVLISQQQAKYEPKNIGHFGLGLEAYAHFTSPIRRYSDLVVHRALIAALKLPGGGGVLVEDPAELSEIAAQLYITERRAIKAERDAVSRHVAVYYEQFIGDDVEVSVVRVFRHGLIVLFTDTKAEGFIPRDLLADGHYIFDEERHFLYDRDSGRGYSMGDVLAANIQRVDTLTGSVVLKALSTVQSHRQAKGAVGGKKAKKKSRGKKPVNKKSKARAVEAAAVAPVKKKPKRKKKPKV